MPQIELLDENTIDKIAAGEVVERPSSVVKELVENAIDAKATAVTVEIKEGGISMIRITDNGCGIDRDQIGIAFCRHSTSKIRSVEDLLTISSLGFRGEALSSIAAVSQVELITKTPDSFTGCRYRIEGGKEISLEEIGAPNGTTFLVKNLFYNTPARRKFLKSAQTEAGYISDLMERMALSHPEVSFKFMNNGQIRLHTSGNGQLKDIIYHIYGRDIAANILEIGGEFEGVTFSGYIGKPVIARGNRNFESYFINGRYVKSPLISKAIEDAYHGFMMQHKYPFTVLAISIDGRLVDVNVHPNKMELRFSNAETLYNHLLRSISGVLRGQELIANVSVKDEKKAKVQPTYDKRAIPEPFETKRREKLGVDAANARFPNHNNHSAIEKSSPQQKSNDVASAHDGFLSEETLAKIRQSVHADSPYERKYAPNPVMESQNADAAKDIIPDSETGQTFRHGYGFRGSDIVREDIRYDVAPKQLTDVAPLKGSARGDIRCDTTPKQVSLSDYTGEKTRLLSEEARPHHRIIGQLFETYWLVEFQDKFYMIDQHAAHEKVLYEQTMANYKNKEFTSQMISPPIVLSLSMQEEALLKKHLPEFEKLGFEIASFGGKEYTVSAVPANLYGLNGQALLLELIDELGSVSEKDTPDMVMEKVASMSCKAAVKGNQKLSRPEIEQLIDDLLKLNNPYFCPHGRPVIIAMSKYEIEKKFKRIV